MDESTNQPTPHVYVLATSKLTGYVTVRVSANWLVRTKTVMVESTANPIARAAVEEGRKGNQP